MHGTRRLVLAIVRSMLVVPVLACFHNPIAARLPFGRETLGVEEITADAGPTAYDTVERRRPFILLDNGLYARGQSPELITTQPIVVYVNEIRFGSVDALRSIPSQSVASIRFVRPTDAMTRFGSGHTGGVILVELRDKAPQ